MKILGFLLVLAFSALCRAELLITPTRSPHKHDLNEGKSAPITFYCKAPGDITAADADLKWFFGDTQITDTYPNMSAGINKFINVMNAGKTLKLQIIQASEDDIGTYTCKGVVNGKEEEGNMQLEVFYGIKVTSPTEQYAVQGTNAKIWCRMKQTSVTKTITWYHGNYQGIVAGDKYYMGYSSESQNEGNFLEIMDIQLADGGQYICQIEMMSFEPPLTHAHFINVIVTVPPSFDIPITMEPMSPKEGDTVRLTCKAEGKPEPTYMFRKDGIDLMEERSLDGVYEIENAQRTDEGTYVCEAQNKGGVKETEVLLDIYIMPIIENKENITKDEYDEVRFPCSATGDPMPYVSWRKKESDTHFPLVTDGAGGHEVYLEGSSDAAEQDKTTKVFHKTTYLVIKKVKPSDAGEYVCSASNAAGEVEKTFKIDVKYKPNFENQMENRFWGWVGSKTNLTCIANGNPEPLIKWYKGSRDLTDDPNYKITNGKSGLPTRAISYLTPNVTNANVGEVFGDYKCEAANNYGTNEEELQFDRAVPPKEAIVTVVDNKPTYLELHLQPPEDDGGQPVHMYIVTYGTNLKLGEITGNKTEARGPDDKITRVKLVNLKANTQYDIEVTPVSNVGRGDTKTITETTAHLSKPDPVQIESPKQGSNAKNYKLSWTVPMTGGAPISNYKVEYTKVLQVETVGGEWRPVRLAQKAKTLNVEGQNNNQIVLTDLERKTYYQVKVNAVNSIGSSEETVFIFKTGEGEGIESGREADEEMVDSAEDSGLDSKPILDSDTAASDDKMKFKGDTDDSPALGSGGIVGLVLVLLLVLVLAVDAAFCKTKQCGLMWTISRLIGSKEEGAAAGGKSPEEGDEAAAKLLGKEKDDSLKTENEVAKDTEAEQAEEAEPETPEKKELEPEDKEEKPLSETVTEEPAKEKTPAEADTGATEQAGEPTPTVQTQPATPDAGDKTDTTANA